MEKNEVVKSEEILVNDTSDLKDVKIELGIDFKEIVKVARFEVIKNKYGVRHPYMVTFFNDEKVEFADTDGLYDLIMSYEKCGVKGYLKSRQLIEEIKTTDEGVTKYICIKYVLSDGSVYRLFPKKFVSSKIIYNYYAFYKKQQEEKK